MFAGRLSIVALALVVAGAPLAPPDHVHEAEDHEHEHVLVHRHLAAHGHGHHQAAHDGSFDDDDDDPILTLDPVYTVPSTIITIGAPPRSVVALDSPPVIDTSSAFPVYVERLIHGPPRGPTGLRAPPSSSRL